jgi:hypothetical protein
MEETVRSLENIGLGIQYFSLEGTPVRRRRELGERQPAMGIHLECQQVV